MVKPTDDAQELGERILRILKEQKRPMDLKEIGRELGIFDLDRLSPGADYLLESKQIAYDPERHTPRLGPYFLPEEKK